MKKKSLFVMGMALLAFSACSNDDFTTENGKGVDAAIESGELTYITIKVANGPSTRIGDGIAESGGAENKSIKNVQVLIFDATTNSLEVNKVYTSADIVQNTMSKQELVTPGTKKVYVLANLIDNMPVAAAALDPTTFAPKASNSTLDIFLKMTHTLAATGGLGALVGERNGYVMSSLEKEATKVFEAGVTNKDEDAQKNVFQFNLYYMLSKLAIRLDSESVLGDLGSGINGALSSPEFVVRNIAKKFYLIQKDPIQGVYYDSIPKTNPELASSWHQFYKVPTYQGFISISSAPMPATGVLMTENVVRDPKIGNTTYAAIRAKFNPTNGHVVTDASWSETLNALVLTKGNVDARGDFARSAKAYTNLPLGTIFKDAATAIKAITIAKNNGTTGNETAIENEDYYFHNAGICYYRMNVGADAGSGVTKNSVERGRSYEATIKKITGFGYNTEGKLDGSDTTGPIKPEDPLNQNTYITVSVTAMGWVPTATEGELN